MDIAVKFTPNNEIRLVLQSLPVRLKNGGDKTAEKQREMYARHGESSLAEVVEGDSCCAVISNGKDGEYVCTKQEGSAVADAAKRSLDIIRDFQQTAVERKNERLHQVKPGYGAPCKPTKFGAFAKRRLLSAGNVLSHRSRHPSESVLVTATLPGDSADAYKDLSEWSGWIVGNILQRLREGHRRIRRYTPGSQLSYFYVWEFQKRGALHLHLCINTPVPEHSLALGNIVAESWKSQLKALGCKSNSLLRRRNGKSCYLPESWQVDVSPVRKNVAAYLSKYVGKNANKSNPDNERGSKSRYYPARWWGMDRLLTKSVEDSSTSIKLRGIEPTKALQLVDSLLKEVRSITRPVQTYSRHDVIEWKNRVIGEVTTIGLYVKSEVYSVLREWIPELLCYLVPEVDRGNFVYKNCPSASNHPYRSNRSVIAEKNFLKDSITKIKNAAIVGVVELIPKTWQEAVKELAVVRPRKSLRELYGLMGAASDSMRLLLPIKQRCAQNSSDLSMSIEKRQMTIWDFLGTTN